MRKLIRYATAGMIFIVTMLLLVRVSQLDNQGENKVGRVARAAQRIVTEAPTWDRNTTVEKQRKVAEVCIIL